MAHSPAVQNGQCQESIVIRRAVGKLAVHNRLYFPAESHRVTYTAGAYFPATQTGMVEAFAEFKKRTDTLRMMGFPFVLPETEPGPTV